MTSTATVIVCTSKFQTPGPGSYMPPSYFGNESPKYTIKNQFPEKKKVLGPGYNDMPNSIGKGPKYSFGNRRKEPDGPSSPGPSYIPPAFGSNSVKISFHGRSEESIKSQTPGPGHYIDPKLFSGDLGGRKYSIRGRIFAPESNDSSPGPGGYNPDYSKVLPSARKASLGSRLPERKIESTPGPYDIPSCLSPRNISFHLKHREPKYDQTPGPAAYSPRRALGEDAPKFTIRPRCDINKRIPAIPYQKLPDITGNEGRKIAFSSRPEDPKIQASPGPSYVPPAFGSDAPKMVFKGRGYESKKQTTPGPSYIPSPDNKKGITIRGRNFAPDEGKVVSPGPGCYNPDYSVVLPSPRMTTWQKPQESKKKVVPSPGPYYIKPQDTGPKFTIGRRDPHGVLPGRD